MVLAGRFRSGTSAWVATQFSYSHFGEVCEWSYGVIGQLEWSLWELGKILCFVYTERALNFEYLEHFVDTFDNTQNMQKDYEFLSRFFRWNGGARLASPSPQPKVVESGVSTAPSRR